MRSPFAYVPRPRPLQEASAGAAIFYVGSFAVFAFIVSNPILLAACGLGVALAGVLAGAPRAVGAGFRLGLTLAVLITVVNGLVTDRGETVLARLGDWPLLGDVTVTAEALATGAVIGLRAGATMIAAAAYSACVDPDRVLRLLRPLAARSALTATLVSRLVPLAAADHIRLRDASMLRGPGAAPVGRGAMVRRLLAGSLDRSVDVAATLELRGYGLGHSPQRERHRGRFDARFAGAGVFVMFAALVAEITGAGDLSSYPVLEFTVDPMTFGIAALVVACGFAPARRKGDRCG